MVEEKYFTLIASTYYCLILWIKGIRGLGIIISTLGFPFQLLVSQLFPNISIKDS